MVDSLKIEDLREQSAEYRALLRENMRLRLIVSVFRVLFMLLDFTAAASLFWLAQRLWPGMEGMLVFIIASLATLGHSMARDWRRGREKTHD